MPLRAIAPEKSGLYSRLVLDYLQQHENLRPFINHWPDHKGFAQQIKERSGQQPDRQLLVKRLREQYQNIELGSAVGQNLQLLEKENTFTLTTGQQIHIFLGPMYVYWKIVSTIALCRKLKKEFPENDFVPVFWMATEDHDFAEVNHLELFNREFIWEGSTSNAVPVGRMATSGLSELTDEVNALFERQSAFAEYAALFKKAYSEFGNFAMATRFLVHELFKEEGLLILDPDDAELKKPFDAVVKKELLENSSKDAVEQSSKALAEHYNLQVHPREINLFFSTEEGRERIIVEEGMAKTLGGIEIGLVEEIESWIEVKRKDISANVVLRPVYQECILPNLAYIGGPGEIAYWLQLKGVFDSNNVPFPILENRKSVFILGAKSQQLVEKSGLSEDDLFLEEHDLRVKALEASGGGLLQLEEELNQLTELKDRVIGKAASIMPASARQLADAFNQTEKIIKKIDKEIFTLQEAGQLKTLEKVLKVKALVREKGFTQERNHYLIQYLIQLDNSAILDTLTKQYETMGPVAWLLDSE